MKELIILTADKSMQVSVETLLRRYHSLGIRSLRPAEFDTIVQPNFDASVYLGGHELLRSQSARYRHAIMMCDRHGCGQEQLTREELEQRMEERLRRSGWSDRAAAIVIDPELEAWVWTDSPHVEEILGWRRRQLGLREWMRAEGYLAEGQVKPVHPQRCLDEALRIARKPRSSALFRAIGERVSLRRCTDSAFLKFVSILQKWFPEPEDTRTRTRSRERS